MCDPVDTTKVKPLEAIQNALCEIISVQSSLNMYPDPIPPEVVAREIGEDRTPYLSDSDHWVKHAMEHLHASFRLMQMAHHDQEALKMQIFRLCEQISKLGAKPCVKTWLDEDPLGMDE
jgi:hypothetical protein